MLVLKDFVYQMLDIAIWGYTWIVLIYCVAGFFVSNRNAGWFVFLYELAEPSLRFVRRLTGNRLVVERFDLSPLVLFFALKLLQYLLAYLFGPSIA